MNEHRHVKRNKRLSRRGLLSAAAAMLATGAAPNARTAALALTPRQSRGPFYPVSLPLDSDNDLTRIDGHDQAAMGVITDIYGRVLDTSGRPLAGVTVEIWQCDANGRYHHPRDTNASPDVNFQGYGRYTTDASGGYRFRTIRPVPYPGRTPHIHFALSGGNVQPLVTQMYLRGEAGNQRDALFRALGQAAHRVVVDLRAAEQAGAVLQGEFNIVLKTG